MIPEEPGLHIDPQVLIQTQSNFIGQARIKEVQMEAAIQQLLGENQQLKAQVEALEGSDDLEVEQE